MSIKTQGTHIYFVDNITTPTTPKLVKLDCPTGVSGVGSGQKSQINNTCLDATESEQYLAGLAAPSALSVPYNFDPSKASHQVLNKLKDSGEVIEWMICLSDGTAAPTLASKSMAAPAGRTSVKFSAYVAENVIEVATNDVVKGTASLQRSGSEVWTYKG
ncbi:phage tail tube protein [Neisseria weixii]|nr:phage tail tube protein [Neisseria weixii]